MPKGIYEHHRIDPVVRFWRRVTKTDGCWLWVGAVNNKGYGIFTIELGKQVLAHKFSFVLANPEVEPNDDLLTLHKCDVRRCVRPDHLWRGTSQENTNDMMQKGRWILPRHIAAKINRIGDRQWQVVR